MSSTALHSCFILWSKLFIFTDSMLTDERCDYTMESFCEGETLPRKRGSEKISHGPNTFKRRAIVSDRIQWYFIDLIELVVSFVKLGRRGFCCLEIVKNPEGVKLYVYDLVNHTGRRVGRLCVHFHIGKEP